MWPWVRDGFERAKRKTGDPCMAEDVYAALMERRAHLYVSYSEDGEPDFFGVFVPENEWGIKTLSIWVAANLGGPELLAPAMEWTRGFAKHHGFQKITFTSPRKGWAKHFKVAQIIYEVSL